MGLDMRGENAETLKALGYEAQATPIEALDIPRRFNVVSMADVLENTPFPRQALESAHKHLKPKGALFVTLPNMDTIIWRMMEGSGRNPYWAEIGQYHQFTRERFYWLLHRCGFEPVSYNISERHRSCMEVIALKA
jgi:SAM-dependent methyltransferase